MRVDLTDVTASYGETVAIDHVSIGVGTGSWLGLIGPNGAGKSTLLKLLVGLVPATGTRTFDGAPAPDRHRATARLVAYVPQRPELPGDLTVVEYVLLGRTPHLPPLGRESALDRDVAETATRRLGLETLRSRMLGTLSGGEAQRAVLARALCQEAPVLLLDEPTTGLDLGHQQQVLELVDEIRHERSITVIAAMHDLVLAGQFADVLALVVRGSIVAHGAADEVLTEENLEEHFAAQVARFHTANHPSALLPVRPGRTTPEAPSGPAPPPAGR